MIGLIIHILFLFIGLVIFAWSLLSVYNRSKIYRRFQEILLEKINYEPSVSVLVPVRGRDEKLDNNLNAIFSLDYPKNKHEIIFIADEDDAIYEYLKKKCTSNSKVIKSTILPGTSGKNSALLSGVKVAKYDVIAVMDSDTLPQKNWLRSIVSPLKSDDVAVTTGYRFYVPGKSFTSYILSAWNSIGLRQMAGRLAFVWGGSFAIKKSVLTKLGIIEKWRKTLSDDAVITNAARKAGLKIGFVPQCITRSHLSYTFSHPLEFTTRQLTLVKLYDSKTWKIAMFLFLFERITTILGITLLYLYTITLNPLFAFESFLMLWPVVFGLLKASIEHRNLKKLIGENIGSRTKYTIADFFAQWLMTYNLLRAWKKKTLEWRGRTYKINSAYDIKVVENK